MSAAHGPGLPARWFDGRSARARPAELRLLPAPDGPGLHLRALDGAGETLRLAHRQVGWPERWSATRPPSRVLLDLGAHGSLQIDDVPAWQAAVARAGHRPSLAERMQTRWPVLLGVLLLVAVGLGAFHRWGTPWLAAQLTRQVPLGWEQRLSGQALARLDERLLKPSRLAPARQVELRAGFDRLAGQIDPRLRRYRGYAPPFELQFRAGMPANAFALPGGTIVLTDDMVEQAARLPAGAGDTALLGVLAHEMGHVLHRHGTRMVVEQGVLQVGLGLALGDVSTLLSSGASLLTGLAYQRGHERESDCFAIALMRQAGLGTAPMADLLGGIEAGGAAAPGPAASAPKPAAQPGRRADWFSTHPDTAGRAERLRAGQPCA